MPKQKIYELIAEDLSHLGGMMGTEYTTESSMGLFSGEDGLEKAKKKAEKDYGKKIKWTNKVSRKSDILRSPDLGYIMYHIKERNAE